MSADQDNHVRIPVPTGDLFDRISILRIKADRLTDTARIGNVVKEFSLLLRIAEEVLDTLDANGRAAISEAYGQLYQVNLNLWEVEEDIRRAGRSDDSTELFVYLARKVYTLNDRRAVLKANISIGTGSALFEEKQYASYED